MPGHPGTVMLLAAGLGCGALLHSQVCRLSVAGLNQSRKVMGPVHAECPDEVFHTAPFGNWGVASNYGQKGNSHQFDGLGNYTFGLNEQSMFHEIDVDSIDRPRGMDITVVTSATTDDEGRALLRALGFPFKEN